MPGDRRPQRDVAFDDASITQPMPDRVLVMRGGLVDVVGQNLSLRVDEDRKLIGRAPGCALVLRDDTVSSVHVEMQATPKGVRIADLDSSNGTFLLPSGVRIEKAYLTEACEFRCGSQHLRFRPTPAVHIPCEKVERMGGLLGTTPEMISLIGTLRRCVFRADSGARSDGTRGLIPS